MGDQAGVVARRGGASGEWHVEAGRSGVHGGCYLPACLPLGLATGCLLLHCCLVCMPEFARVSPSCLLLLLLLLLLLHFCSHSCNAPAVPHCFRLTPAP